MHNKNLTLIPIGEEIGIKAAEMRAKYGLKLPDAIQVATGIAGGCDAFLTNDATLRKVKELHVITV